MERPSMQKAVKFTYDSILEPELKSLTAIGYLGPYESAVAVDDQTVKINFSGPYAPFLNNLSHSVLAPVSPAAVEKYGDDFGFRPGWHRAIHVQRMEAANFDDLREESGLQLAAGRIHARGACLS